MLKKMKKVKPPELVGNGGYLEAVGTFTLEYTMITPWLPEDKGRRVKVSNACDRVVPRSAA